MVWSDRWKSLEGIPLSHYLMYGLEKKLEKEINEFLKKVVTCEKPLNVCVDLEKNIVMVMWKMLYDVCLSFFHEIQWKITLFTIYK